MPQVGTRKITEVQNHLANGERDLHRWLEEYGVKAIDRR
jgi:hypothetical protein